MLFKFGVFGYKLLYFADPYKHADRMDRNSRLDIREILLLDIILDEH